MKRNVELLLLISVVLISVFGLVMIYSSSYVWAEYKYNDPYKYVKYQGLFFIIGLFIMYLVSNIDYKVYYRKANLILLGCVILLV